MVVQFMQLMLSQQDPNLPRFSFHLHVCSFFFSPLTNENNETRKSSLAVLPLSRWWRCQMFFNPCSVFNHVTYLSPASRLNIHECDEGTLLVLWLLWVQFLTRLLKKRAKWNQLRNFSYFSIILVRVLYSLPDFHWEQTRTAEELFTKLIKVLK